MDRDEFKDRKYLPRGEWQYTKEEKIKNWFYYYKWWLVGGAVGIVFLIAIIRAMLGIGVVKPDYEVALVTSGVLPNGVSAELEAALASLGEDLNGDGVVKVTVNEYSSPSGVDAATDAQMVMANSVRLQADLMSNQSYIFIMEDPADFQMKFGVLTDGSGALPDEGDADIDGRVYRWTDCPALASLEFSDITKEILEGTFVGVRGFGYNVDNLENLDGWRALWGVLTEGAK